MKNILFYSGDDLAFVFITIGPIQLTLSTIILFLFNFLYNL